MDPKDAPVMQTQLEPTRIILLDGSSFLHEVLKRAINKQEDLQVIADVRDMERYPETAAQVEADWTYLLLSPEAEIPVVVQETLEANPAMGLLVMATDGSSVRVRWLEQHEEDLEIEALDEIFAVLQKKGISVDNNLP
jgi:hypothetical protein